MQKIVSDLKKENNELEHVTVFSDGSGSQFKNKYTLSNILHSKSDLDVTCEWHFFPTSHGKSPADGIGGTVKRGVSNRVLTGQLEVNNAKDFIECASSFTQKIHLIHATTEETEAIREKMQNRWEGLKTIPGTRGFHCFKPLYDSGQIEAFVSSREEGRKAFKIIK